MSTRKRMFVALAKTCDIDWRECSRRERGQLNQSEKILRDNERTPATPDQVLAFREWWDAHDWRGQQGEPPTPVQVRNEWGRFLHWRGQEDEDPLDGWERVKL